MLHGHLFLILKLGSHYRCRLRALQMTISITTFRIALSALSGRIALTWPRKLSLQTLSEISYRPGKLLFVPKHWYKQNLQSGRRRSFVTNIIVMFDCLKCLGLKFILSKLTHGILILICAVKVKFAM